MLGSYCKGRAHGLHEDNCWEGSAGSEGVMAEHEQTSRFEGVLGRKDRADKQRRQLFGLLVQRRGQQTIHYYRAGVSHEGVEIRINYYFD